MVDQVLDTKGLNCPIPIVKAKKALQGMDRDKCWKSLLLIRGQSKILRLLAAKPKMKS